MIKYIVLLILSSFIYANDALTVVAVGDAEVVTEKLLVEKLFTQNGVTPKEVEKLEKGLDIIRNDYRFYQHLFNVVPRKISKNNFEKFDYDEYKAREVSHVIRVEAFKKNNQISLNYKLANVGKEEIVNEGSFILEKDLRRTFHRISDSTFKAIVKTEPVFLHKLVFVSDKNSRRGQKELFMMDFDGGNKRQLTYHRGLVISPAVSPDGKKILYSLIDEKKVKRKNINLRILDLNTNKSSVISRMKGINSGAVFTSDGESIILTLSHQGNAELYKMDLKTKKKFRLTKHGAPDVDPSISADGSLLTFLSGRPGQPMIYTMVPNKMESQVKRISYVGQFNATPRFSPNGKEIVFSSWLDNRFDLFKINSDGSGLGRLTKDFGSNEDPVYSKDGQFIAFTSQRVLSRTKAVQNIYIMDREGKVLSSITPNFGKCISPRWLK